MSNVNQGVVSGQTSSCTICVLVIDDDKELAEIVAERVRKLTRAEVETCYTVKSAIELLTSHVNKFRLVITDFNIGNETANSIIQFLKTASLSTNVLVMTGGCGNELETYDLPIRVFHKPLPNEFFQEVMKQIAS